MRSTLLLLVVGTSSALEQLHKTHGEFHRHLAFDFGFFNGDDTRLLLSQGYRVVALEANPLLWSKGQEKYSNAIKDGRLHLLHAGLPVDASNELSHEQPNAEGRKDSHASPEGRNLTFYVNRHNAEWSSFSRGTGCRGQNYFSSDKDLKVGQKVGDNCEEVPIRITSCTQLLAKFGIPVIMKLDVEGGEWTCMHALKHTRHRPSYVVIENTVSYDFDLMTELGYDSFKYVNQGFPSVSDWGSTSGPMGEYGLDCELKWKWRGVESVANVHDSSSAFVKKPEIRAMHPTCNGWADIHARHEVASKKFFL